MFASNTAVKNKPEIDQRPWFMSVMLQDRYRTFNRPARRRYQTSVYLRCQQRIFGDNMGYRRFSSRSRWSCGTTDVEHSKMGRDTRPASVGLMLAAHLYTVLTAK
jgi:hypothetical protein